MGMGATFALSFDTARQAATFAVTAARFDGWYAALAFAVLFIAGMLATDGINGWCIARRVRRADQTARVASRVMALAISGVGLLVAGLGAAGQLLPAVDAWTQDKSLWVGAAVVAVLLLSFAIGQRWRASRRCRYAARAGRSTHPRRGVASMDEYRRSATARYGHKQPDRIIGRTVSFRLAAVAPVWGAECQLLPEADFVSERVVLPLRPGTCLLR